MLSRNITVVVTLVLAASTLIAAEPRRCVRREFRALSDNDRSKYFKTLRRAMDDGKYDQYTKNYNDNVRRHHNGPGYFTWHRAHLREFEKMLQEYDPDVCLHTWDHSLDSQSPECSPIWHDDWYGRRNDADGCVKTSWHDNWQPAYPQKHCVRRQYDGGDTIGSFHSYEMINRCITQSNSYDDFRQRFEHGIGNVPHYAIGGDMASMYPSNDPLWYAHHAYVDKVYHQWQKYRPEYANTYSGNNWDGQAVSYDDRMEPYGYTARDVLDSDKMGYGYEEISYDKLYNVRLPEPSRQLRVRALAIEGGISSLVSNATAPVIAPVIAALPTANGAAGVAADVGTALPTAATAPTTNATSVTTPIVTGLTAAGNVTSGITNVNGTTVVANATTNGTAGVLNLSAASVHVSPPIDTHTAIVPIPRDSAHPPFNFNDRSQVVGLRHPRPCPDEYRNQWGYQADRHIAYENEYRDKYDDLNKIYGYVSPNSLYYRPDLFACSAPRVKTFCVDVPDVCRVECNKDEYTDSTDPYQIVADFRYKFKSMLNDNFRAPASIRDRLYEVTGPYAGDAMSAQNFMEQPVVKLQSEAMAAAFKSGMYGTLFAAAVVGLVNL